jgi:hypothetical protein
LGGMNPMNESCQNPILGNTPRWSRPDNFSFPSFNYRERTLNKSMIPMLAKRSELNLPKKLKIVHPGRTILSPRISFVPDWNSFGLGTNGWGIRRNSETV